MVIVSACLAGIPCRYNAEAKTNEMVLDLVKQGKAIPLRPEQLGGLTTPREPSELKDGKVLSKSGTDVTSAFAAGAQIVLDFALINNCRVAILKSKSPSCGSEVIYDGSFSKITDF